MKKLLLLVLLLFSSSSLYAHETETGWKYDIDCCSEKDCARASKVEYIPSKAFKFDLRQGQMFDITVTTSHGVVTFTRQWLIDNPQKIRISKDDDIHACMRHFYHYYEYDKSDLKDDKMVPLCIYLPNIPG